MPIHTNSTNRSFRGLCNVTETLYILFCFYLFDIVFVFEHRKCFHFFSSIRVVIYQFQKFVLSSTKQEFCPFFYVSWLFNKLINEIILIVEFITCLGLFNIDKELMLFIIIRPWRKICILILKTIFISFPVKHNRILSIIVDDLSFYSHNIFIFDNIIIFS